MLEDGLEDCAASGGAGRRAQGGPKVATPGPLTLVSRVGWRKARWPDGVQRAGSVVKGRGALGQSAPGGLYMAPDFRAYRR